MSQRSTSNQPLFNLSEFIIGERARKTPNAIALKIISDAPQNSLPLIWTYFELNQAILKIAGGLIDEGLMKGDFLPLRMKSDTPFALTFFGAIAAGIVPVPLSPQLTAKEVEFFLKDTEAKHCAITPNLPMPRSLVHPIKQISEQKILSFLENNFPSSYIDTKENDPAFLIYSSGTTSKPKGVLHAHRVAKGRLPMQAGWHQMNEDDIVLHAGEFNWTYTLGVGLMDPWLWGATALIYSSENKEAKSPKLWPKLIKDHNVSIFAAVPGIYRQILKYTNPSPEDLQTLRHGLTAGEALNKELHDEWHHQTKTKLYEALGQSEISTYVSTTKGLNLPSNVKGRIQKGRKVTVLKEDTDDEQPIHCAPGEDGLIAIHKSEPGLMLQYWKRPEEMKNAFSGEWFITGDRGSIDEENNLTHLGRVDEVMNAGGYRVSPKEIETILTSHKDVAEAAVCEQQVRPDLSIISAFIVLKEESTAEDQILNDVQDLLSANLARYKHPKSFNFVKKLPRNQAGKLIRKDLLNLEKN